jgi:SAM-dependent methyltransferase
MKKNLNVVKNVKNLIKKLISFFKKSLKKILKIKGWSKIALITGIILIVLMIVNKDMIYKEGFTQKEKFILKRGNEIYDEFYTDIYDDLTLDKVKNDFEVGEIKRLIKVNSVNRVLDIGSGSGQHVNLLNKSGFKAEGVDKSEEMIKHSKNKFPNLTFKKGDVLQSMLYPEQSFSTITCFYFTLYYIKDKNTFFKNCYNWLMPGGYLIIHLVNRDKFDPILNVADPLHLVSAQKYAKKRITSSLVKFKDFQYKANFDLDKKNNLAEFNEIFKDDKSKNIRQNSHKLYMETQKHILGLAKNVGFILKGKIDMITVQYQHQYLYLLYKPS